MPDEDADAQNGDAASLWGLDGCQSQISSSSCAGKEETRIPGGSLRSHGENIQTPYKRQWELNPDLTAGNNIGQPIFKRPVPQEASSTKRWDFTNKSVPFAMQLFVSLNSVLSFSRVDTTCASGAIVLPN